MFQEGCNIIKVWELLQYEITRCRWEDNIKICLREIGWGGMDWIDLGQDRNQ
jgi:hypothetical protein